MKISALLLAGFASMAAAQEGARRDPSKWTASEPRFEYRSAFSDYRSFSEEKLAPWRDVNDEVGRIGGHAGATGHAKPAPTKPGAVPEGAKPPAKAPAAHGSH
jgi:hypothetical protein